jgi:arginase
MFKAALAIPQWQGTASIRKYREGHAICREVLAKRFADIHNVNVPADEMVYLRHGILAHDALVRNYRAVQAVVRQLPQPLFTLGGDCSVDYVPIAEVLSQHKDEVALVWIDTHPDLNVPASSVSRHFHGMLVRALLGDSTSPELLGFVSHKLKPQNLFYVAPHDIDPGEAEYIRAKGVFVLQKGEEPEKLVMAIQAAGLGKVHLHLDLDVMDPDYFPHVATPVPGGISPDEVVGILTMLRAQFTVVGGEMSEMSPVGEVTEAHRQILSRILTQGFGF